MDARVSKVVSYNLSMLFLLRMGFKILYGHSYLVQLIKSSYKCIKIGKTHTLGIGNVYIQDGSQLLLKRMVHAISVHHAK